MDVEVVERVGELEGDLEQEERAQVDCKMRLCARDSENEEQLRLAVSEHTKCRSEANLPSARRTRRRQMLRESKAGANWERAAASRRQRRHNVAAKRTRRQRMLKRVEEIILCLLRRKWPS